MWMEEVVLHHHPGSEARLSSLVETTEKLLTPFPCRVPPVFSPWSSHSHLPLRPAKPAPVITHRPGVENIVQRPQERWSADILLQDPKVCVSGTKENILPTDGETSRAPHHGHKRSREVKASSSLRSWSVFTHRGVLLQTSQPLSRRFCHVVSRLQLHLRQRVKWVISKHNCAGDVEQVGRGVR